MSLAPMSSRSTPAASTSASRTWALPPSGHSPTTSATSTAAASDRCLCARPLLGNLLDASVFRYIGDGLVPGLAETGAVPWPWPAIAPAEFVGLAELSPGRRVMSADEAAVVGLSDNGGVVKRVYLLGPDGETICYFSLWPMLPAESS